jgi:hypothetical protein
VCVQALFQCEPFRACVYSFVHSPEKHGTAEGCIPLQLQRLFARMERSDVAALSVRVVVVMWCVCL